MVTIISHSPEQTVELGQNWAKTLNPGTTLFLFGDLGSGKTLLVKGLAKGLGYRGQVRSPSFSIVHIYRGGRFPIYHIDLYRLENEHAIYQAGLESYFSPTDAITVVEWADRWLGHLTPLQAQEALKNFKNPTTIVWLEFIEELKRKITYVCNWTRVI